MIHLIAALLIVLGSAFVFISGLGVFRMPDFYTRMHAATKAGTLGSGLLLLAVSVFFGELGTAVRALAVGVFLLATAPVAAHVLSRAAYLSGVKLWSKTHLDEFEAYCEDLSKQSPPIPDIPEPLGSPSSSSQAS